VIPRRMGNVRGATDEPGFSPPPFSSNGERLAPAPAKNFLVWVQNNMATFCCDTGGAAGFRFSRRASFVWALIVHGPRQTAEGAGATLGDAAPKPRLAR